MQLCGRWSAALHSQCQKQHALRAQQTAAVASTLTKRLHSANSLLPPQVVLAGEFEGEDLPLYDFEIRYRGGLKNALLHPNRPGAEHKLEQGQVGGLSCVEQWRGRMEQRITVHGPVTAGWPGQQCHYECC